LSDLDLDVTVAEMRVVRRAGAFLIEPPLPIRNSPWATSGGAKRAIGCEASMRQRVKQLLKRLWQITMPLRRPMLRKLDAYLAEQLQRQMRPIVQVVAEQLVQLRELNLCAESTIRELVRLQMQLEAGPLAATDSDAETPQNWSSTSPGAAPRNSSQAA
jgi:hypothetical protein